MANICSFKEYMKCEDDITLSKTRKKINRKDKKGRSKNVYGWDGYGPPPNLSGDGGAVGESAGFESQQRHIPNVFNKKSRGLRWVSDYNDFDDYEEDAAVAEPSKKDKARSIYISLRNSGLTREEMIERMRTMVGLSPSSAIDYYQRIAREFGETGPGKGDEAGAQPGALGPGMDSYMMGGDMGDMYGAGDKDEDEYMEPQEWEDPNRQGAIRTVDGAHLVYKRQTDDGSFEELWIYKQGDKLNDEINVRRDILAGTDIPVEKTRSENGNQEAETWAVGNIQFLYISGLVN